VNETPTDNGCSCLREAAQSGSPWDPPAHGVCRAGQCLTTEWKPEKMDEPGPPLPVDAIPHTCPAAPSATHGFTHVGSTHHQPRQHVGSRNGSAGLQGQPGWKHSPGSQSIHGDQPLPPHRCRLHDAARHQAARTRCAEVARRLRPGSSRIIFGPFKVLLLARYVLFPQFRDTPQRCPCALFTDGATRGGYSIRPGRNYF